jgi:hypothetical protein
MTKSARPESPKAIGVLKNMLRTVIEPLHPPSFSFGKIRIATLLHDRSGESKSETGRCLHLRQGEYIRGVRPRMNGRHEA